MAADVEIEIPGVTDWFPISTRPPVRGHYQVKSFSEDPDRHESDDGGLGVYQTCEFAKKKWASREHTHWRGVDTRLTDEKVSDFEQKCRTSAPRSTAMHARRLARHYIASHQSAAESEENNPNAQYWLARAVFYFALVRAHGQGLSAADRSFFSRYVDLFVGRGAEAGR